MKIMTNWPTQTDSLLNTMMHICATILVEENQCGTNAGIVNMNHVTPPQDTDQSGMMANLEHGQPTA